MALDALFELIAQDAEDDTLVALEKRTPDQRFP